MGENLLPVSGRSPRYAHTIHHYDSFVINNSQSHDQIPSIHHTTPSPPFLLSNRPAAGEHRARGHVPVFLLGPSDGVDCRGRVSCQTLHCDDFSLPGHPHLGGHVHRFVHRHPVLHCDLVFRRALSCMFFFWSVVIQVRGGTVCFRPTFRTKLPAHFLVSEGLSQSPPVSLSDEKCRSLKGNMPGIGYLASGRAIWTRYPTPLIRFCVVVTLGVMAGTGWALDVETSFSPGATSTSRRTCLTPVLTWTCFKQA